jgi:hypothetical protein
VNIYFLYYIKRIRGKEVKKIFKNIVFLNFTIVIVPQLLIFTYGKMNPDASAKFGLKFFFSLFVVPGALIGVNYIYCLINKKCKFYPYIILMCLMVLLFQMLGYIEWGLTLPPNEGFSILEPDGETVMIVILFAIIDVVMVIVGGLIGQLFLWKKKRSEI